MLEGIRVLLIDDDPDFTMANSIFLDSTGIDVVTVPSRAEGLAKIEEDKPDVVVIELYMENSDEGFAVVRKIRAGTQSEVPVIMLSSIREKTGYSFVPEEHPGYCPVEGFLEKPVSPSMLLQSIRDALKVAEL